MSRKRREKRTQDLDVNPHPNNTRLQLCPILPHPPSADTHSLLIPPDTDTKAINTQEPHISEPPPCEKEIALFSTINHLRNCAR